MIEVKVGQVWKDNDKRVSGRFIKITAVTDNTVTAVNIRTGKESKISLKRLKPTAQGYTLIEDVA